LNGDLFADGAGSGEVIATLPLAEGYTTTFHNLDARTLQPKAVQLAVVGTESVTVPAGTFDAFKVNVSSQDGGNVTYWIAKSPKRPVKVTATSPAMNGAIVTFELEKHQ
jgi:hypothetical protein